MKMKYITTATMIAAALALSGSGCHKPKGKAETTTEIKQRLGIPVETTMPVSGSIESELAVNGQLKGRNEAPIYPKIGGRVLQILVNNGDVVKKGQVLVRIETKEIADGVAQARAAVAGANSAVKLAEQQVSLVRKGARPQERTQMENQLELAKQGFDIAQKNIDRMQTLLTNGVVSQQQYDAVKIQYDMAKTQYENAKQQMSIVNTGARDEERRMAESGLEQAKHGRDQARAALALALEQLNSGTITAPSSGIVSSRIIDPGTLIGPGMPYPIMTIVDNSSFNMVAQISETDLHKVRIGQLVRLKVDAMPRTSFTGKITEINFSPSMGAQTYEVKIIVVKNAGGNANHDKLKSGMNATGYIVVEKHTDTLVVPKDALQSRPGVKAALFVVKDGKAVMRKVETGIINGTRAEIKSGISAADEVVVVGASGLQNGDKLNVTRKGVK